MNMLNIKNSNIISASRTVSNTNAAFTFGVRFFAYSVFYYFYFFFSGAHSQRLQRVTV